MVNMSDREPAIETMFRRAKRPDPIERAIYKIVIQDRVAKRLLQLETNHALAVEIEMGQVTDESVSR